MLSNYTPAQRVTYTEHQIAFDDGRGNGFGFPCDENGELLEGLTPEAVANYHRCLERPKDFARYNKVITMQRSGLENAHGTCSCGAEVELYNQYMGACQCPKCSKWYNLFGQELLPPAEWEED